VVQRADFQTKQSHFHWFEVLSRNTSSVQHSGCFQRCWHACAGMNRCKTTLFCLLIVINEIVCNEMLVKIICHEFVGLRGCWCLPQLVNSESTCIGMYWFVVVRSHLCLHTLKSCWLEKFRFEIKTLDLVAFKLVFCYRIWQGCCAKLWTSVRLELSRFIWLKCFREIPILFITMYAVSDVGVSALGWTVTQVTLINMYFLSSVRMCVNERVVCKILSLA
jgi:hypothetical protein